MDIKEQILVALGLNKEETVKLESPINGFEPQIGRAEFNGTDDEYEEYCDSCAI